MQPQACVKLCVDDVEEVVARAMKHKTSLRVLNFRKQCALNQCFTAAITTADQNLQTQEAGTRINFHQLFLTMSVGRA